MKKLQKIGGSAASIWEQKIDADREMEKKMSQIKL